MGGRHVGYVGRYSSGGWWSQYNRERNNPITRKTKAEAVAAVERNAAARSANVTITAGPGPPPPPTSSAGRFRRTASESRVRADQRTEAAAAEATFRDALTAGRPDLGSGRIKAPPPRERIAKRFGGGTRATTGDYDWFYELHPDEQSRIRRNWMSEAGGTGVSPDEVEDMGLPMAEWLALTRGIDAARAVQTGKQLQARRYGDRHPLAFLTKGDPADHGEPVRRIHSRRDPSKWHDIDRGARVQYFTANGVVHPIRASYAQRDRAALGSAAQYRAAQRGHTQEEYDDEPF